MGNGIPIDLACDGPTSNDPGDLDEGPNTLLNFPDKLSVADTLDVSVTPALFSRSGTNLISYRLARLYTDQGKYAEAEPLFKQARAIQEKAIPEQPDFADTLNAYADLLDKTDRRADADEMRRQARSKQSPDN